MPGQARITRLRSRVRASTQRARDAVGMERDDTMTVNEAAERMGRHPGTVRRMCERGELEATKVGTEWAIRSTSVAAWSDTRPPGVLNLVIPAEELDVVRDVAHAEGARPADVIRRAVARFVAEQEAAATA